MNLRPQLGGLKFNHHLKATCVAMMFYLPLLSPNFDNKFSSNFHRFGILCMLRYTMWEDLSSCQLPQVSSTSHCSLPASTTNLAQIFIGLVFYMYACWDTPSEVFVNYQRCPVPFKSLVIKHFLFYRSLQLQHLSMV